MGPNPKADLKKLLKKILPKRKTHLQEELNKEELSKEELTK